MSEQNARPTEVEVLSRKQLRRAYALRAARDVLIARTMVSGSAADAADLIHVASWIMTGESVESPVLHHAKLPSGWRDETTGLVSGGLVTDDQGGT